MTRNKDDPWAQTLASLRFALRYGCLCSKPMKHDDPMRSQVYGKIEKDVKRERARRYDEQV